MSGWGPGAGWPGAAAWLLAQDAYVHMGSRFRRGGGGDWRAAAWLLLGLAAAGAAGWLGRQAMVWRRRLARRSPRALFGEVCRAHGLSRTDRQLLYALARRSGAPHPALVFVTPDCWAAEAVGQFPPPARKRLAELQGRLLAGV